MPNKKEYFYVDRNNKKFGAFTREEFFEKEIYEDYLVWYPKIEHWKKAGEIEEFKSFVILTPPLTNNEVQYKVKQVLLKEKQRILVSTAKKFFPYFTLGFITLAIFINSTVYAIAKMQINPNHSAILDFDPLYISLAEKANPSSIFWTQAPPSIAISLVIMLSIFGFTLFKNLSSVDD